MKELFRRASARGLNARWLVLGLVLVIAAPAAAEPIKVSFLSPDPADNLFWGQVMSFMEAAAEDLNIELKTVVSNGNSTISLKRDGMQLINDPDKPDYMVTGYWTGVTDQLLEAADKRDIGFFIFNTDIAPQERLKVGRPRERFSNWIGHMRPDDFTAGYDLAGILADRARSLAGQGDETIEMAAINGSRDSSVAAEREGGLKKQAELTPKLALTDVISTTWHRPTAEKATVQLLESYPDLAAIWTAADALALGVIDTLKARGMQPGVDVVTGGMDWSEQALRAVKRGEMTATLGGHFMEAGWALVLIHDYHKGTDFADDPGLSFVTPMQAITSDNVDRYIEKLGDQDWRKIDFRQFSKQYNPDLNQYDFSLQRVLDNAEAE